MKIIEASIIVIVYNEEKYIKECIESILDQSYKNFELIIVNDGSTDKTSDIINSFHDKRIKVFNHNKNLGYSSARNTGIKNSSCDYIFFTDADCVADKDWVKNGLECIKKTSDNIAGIYGKTKFEKINSINSGPTFIDCQINKYFNFPGTINCIYKKNILDNVNGFNPRYNIGGEDRDIAFRIYIKKYNFEYSNDLIVYHRKKKLTIKRGLILCKRRRHNVFLFKDHAKNFPFLKKSKFCYKFILAPEYLLFILFSPYYFYKLIKNGRIKTLKDVPKAIIIYFGLIYIRLLFWKTAIKEKIFLI